MFQPGQEVLVAHAASHLRSRLRQSHHQSHCGTQNGLKVTAHNHGPPIGTRFLAGPYFCKEPRRLSTLLVNREAGLEFFVLIEAFTGTFVLLLVPKKFAPTKR